MTTPRSRGTMDGSGDAVWILTSAFIIFTMISGFGLVESGMVSRKNEANIMVKNAVDVIFGGLGFWMFGFAFTFGNDDGANAFSGYGNFFTDAEETRMGDVFALYCFQASFATTATTIVSGAVAERMNLKAYIIFAFTNTLTYCFPAHWVWGDNGWLKNMGVVDMGGASPVHLVGGVAGLVATIMLKPRVGRFKSVSGVGAPMRHNMGSPTNVLLGMFMLWWGWLGFNCGSTFGVSGGRWKLASRSAVCTINASCGGGVFATFYSYIKCNRLDIPYFMVGVLGSLVSITAICGVVRPGESLAIGFIGSAISIIGWQLLNRIEIDDPVGAVSTHAGGSIWGMIAVGLFVEKDTLENTFSDTYGAFKGGHVKILGVQLLACVSITAWTIITVFIQLYLIDKSVGLRFPLEEEVLGADACEHGIDQSQAKTESRVRPVPRSQNRVFPTSGGKTEGTTLNDNNRRMAQGENTNGDAELQDCEQTDSESISDNVSQDRQITSTNKRQPSLQEANENVFSNNISSSAKTKFKWDKVLPSKRKSGFLSGNEGKKVPRGSTLPKMKVPVIITLTPADDAREIRLSFSDLNNKKK
ncbi:hypothetical protein ACROYT_G022251 [Oculina patagonica]